jgi:hypothetical protein
MVLKTFDMLEKSKVAHEKFTGPRGEAVVGRVKRIVRRLAGIHLLPAIMFLTPVVKYDYLLKFINSAKQISIEFSIAEIGNALCYSIVNQKFMRDVIAVIYNAFKKCDEIRTQAFLFKLVFYTPQSPPFHGIEWNPILSCKEEHGVRA